MFNILTEEQQAKASGYSKINPGFHDQLTDVCKAQRAKTAWEMVDFLQSEAYKPDGLIQALVNVVKVHLEYEGIERPK